jgi:beta-galactosidase/beta-glucuronidase
MHRLSPVLLGLAGLFAVGQLAPAVAQQTPTFSAETGKTTQPILTGWRFHQAGQENWAPATVPGCVHTDLLATKQIEDPLYRDNELKQQWIGKADWDYETTFEVAPATLQRQHLELVFKGLDTYADVTLNGQAILHTNNMFRGWRAEVKPLLKASGNRLLIHFRSPLNEVADLPKKYGYNLFAINDEQAIGYVGDKGPVLSPYTRKVPYHYGWDWGPRSVGAGIWQPVQLEGWDAAKITDFHVVQRQLSAQAAQLSLVIAYDGAATASGPATLVFETTGPSGQAGPRLEQAVTLQPNHHEVTADLRLDNPQRWFPAGYGAQPLYSFTARLLQGGKPVGEASTRNYAKRFYALALVSPHEEGENVRFYVVSDRTAATPATLQVRLLDFSGKVLYTQSAALQVEPLTSKVYLDIPKTKLLKSQDLKKVVLSCTLHAGGATLSTNTHYFALPKEIALPKAAIAATWQPVSDSTYQVTLKSKALAREVNLSLAEGDGFFGDNYFDLLPGETKVLTFKSEGATSVDKLRKQLVVRTLADAF